MNKKLITYFVIFSFLFVGATWASADEENNDTESDPTPTLFQNNTGTRQAPRANPVNNEIQRKDTLQEQYKQKLDDLKSRYTERKTSIQTERKDGIPTQGNMDASTQNGFNPEERRELTDERKAITKEQIEERRELIKEKLEGQRKERVQSQIDRTGEGFENAIERIHELEKKVHGRIRDMAERGFDMTTPEELIAGTHEKIAEARARIQEMKTALGEIVESEDPSDAFAKARELTDPAKEAVRAAHQSLVEVIKSIRASVQLRVEEQVAEEGNNDTDEVDENEEDEDESEDEDEEEDNTDEDEEDEGEEDGNTTEE